MLPPCGLEAVCPTKVNIRINNCVFIYCCRVLWVLVVPLDLLELL